MGLQKLIMKNGYKGGVWVSLSLEAKNKREKFASSFTAPDFFFKKIYVMKCLRSKKSLKSPVSTTGPGWRIHGSVEDTKLSTNEQHTLSLGRSAEI